MRKFALIAAVLLAAFSPADGYAACMALCVPPATLGGPLVVACIPGCIAALVFCVDETSQVDVMECPFGDDVVLTASAAALVDMCTFSKKTVAEVNPGDYVADLAGWTQVEKVERTGNNDVRTFYIEGLAEGETYVLSATLSHMMITEGDKYIPSVQVEVGDLLATEFGLRKVMSIEKDTLSTANLITKSHSYIANGVIVSQFSDEAHMMQTYMNIDPELHSRMLNHPDFIAAREVIHATVAEDILSRQGTAGPKIPHSMTTSTGVTVYTAGAAIEDPSPYPSSSNPTFMPCGIFDDCDDIECDDSEADCDADLNGLNDGVAGTLVGAADCDDATVGNVQCGNSVDASL